MGELKIFFNNERFEKYYDYLIAENHKYNLTAITEREEVFVKHFEDSITAVDLIPNGANVLDVGAGAGFPSVPLKIMRDDIIVTMLDGVGKKVDFLNRLSKLLSLNGIEAIHTRVEDFVSSGSRLKYDVVVARAVASLNTLAEYALPFVKTGGVFIAYKASGIDDEIKNAQNALDILGGKITQIKPVVLQCKGEQISRNLVAITKIAETPSKYPRKGNKPRLQPL